MQRLLVIVLVFGSFVFYGCDNGKGEKVSAEKAKVEAESLKAEKAKVEVARLKAEKAKVEAARLKAEKAKVEAARLKAEKAKVEAEKLRNPVPPLGPPPSLPKLPEDITWPKETKKELDKIIANYSKDQVSAYLTFEKILKQAKNRPTGKQREWLQNAAGAVRQRAIAVLDRDFKAAVAMLDLRGVIIASCVANKVRKGSLPTAKAALAKLKSDLFSGKSITQSVWKIHQPQGKWLDGSYTEDFGQRITLRPKEGFGLLRVTARVENISATFDPPYISWALGIKGIFLMTTDKKKTQPCRVAMDEFIILVTPGGDWISCSYVCEGSTSLRDTTLTISSKSIFIGGEVKQGADFLADIIFSVPQGIENVRLLILGSPPIPIEIKK